MNRGTFYNWNKVSEKTAASRMRNAGRAFGSLIDRVTPIEPRSCTLSCKFALEYGHSSAATDVAKIWWHFHLSLRRRETERNNNRPKEQAPHTGHISSCPVQKLWTTNEFNIKPSTLLRNLSKLPLKFLERESC